jgi:hypothetical protein
MPVSMPLKISPAVSARCLLLALVVSLVASAAAAANPVRDKHVAVAKYRGPHAKVAMHRHVWLARGGLSRDRGNPSIPPNAIRMPGYIFVPGRDSRRVVRPADQLVPE